MKKLKKIKKDVVSPDFPMDDDDGTEEGVAESNDHASLFRQGGIDSLDQSGEDGSEGGQEEPFKFSEKPGKSYVLQTMEEADSTQYPPKVLKYWGNEVELADVEKVLYISEGNMSFLYTQKQAQRLLKELLVGLTESQVWELYCFIRDIGTLSCGKRSASAMRIQGAVTAKQKANTPKGGAKNV